MMSTQGSLGVEPMCRLAEVSRAGFYRFLQPRYPGEEQMEVRNAIQQIVVEHRRRYGYRRVTVELRRRGMRVNHKRVLRLMREDNLLGIEPKAFLATTQSDHDREVYLNLASRMKLTAINQLWVADITYIRLRQEFVYLAVVLDVFSRKVVGWALDRTLTTRLPLLALQRAITLRQPAAGLEVDFGVEVTRHFQAQGPIACVETPAGRAAVVVHRGAYSGIGAAHAALHRWCSDHGELIGRCSWEIYGDHHDDQSKLETTIFYLLA